MKNHKLDIRGSAGLIILILLVVATIAGGAFYSMSNSPLGTSVKSVVTSHNCAGQSLSEGATGACVKDVQALLNWKVYGINQPSYLAIDGQFAATTTAVVKQLQTKLKVPASGTVDSTIWQVICHGGDAPNWWTAAAADAGCHS